MLKYGGEDFCLSRRWTLGARELRLRSRERPGTTPDNAGDKVLLALKGAAAPAAPAVAAAAVAAVAAKRRRTAGR